MEIDKITLEREFLDKLLSLNYLNESLGRTGKFGKSIAK